MVCRSRDLRDVDFYGAFWPDHENTALRRQIDATGRQIDQLVYELYGSTEEEVKIVEV